MIIKINPECPEIKLIKKAALSLKEGNLLIFPTDTVYGLGANVLDSGAMRKLLEIKKREMAKPFALLIGETDDVYKYCKNIPPLFFMITKRFWPGAITVVLDAQDAMPKEAMGIDSSVALRMPDSSIALSLLREAGVPIAASSANFPGGADPAGIDEIEKSLIDEVALVIDGGMCQGVPSTVVDLRGNNIKILRQGAIAAKEINEG
ncbi:threonylcarbamoyl-AMP synthase [Candidatus Desantisbacteria bacterium]|nr:threonylcarbamoyl-AMP synthase [Candidatus Desantisbacteria bacterium]